MGDTFLLPAHTQGCINNRSSRVDTTFFPKVGFMPCKRVRLKAWSLLSLPKSFISMQSLGWSPSCKWWTGDHHLGHVWPRPLPVELTMGWVGISWLCWLLVSSESGNIWYWEKPGKMLQPMELARQLVVLACFYEFIRISWPPHC